MPFGMKTFTVRELSRTSAVVFAACDRDGVARISHRDGRAYRVQPVSITERDVSTVPDFAVRRHKLFPNPLPVAFARKLDQAISGD